MSTKRSIIVTGGASGIGRASVRLAAKRGWSVLIADLNEADGCGLAAEINGTGGTARFIRVDVGSESDVARMVDTAVSEFGGLDGAVNCAGRHMKGSPITEMSLEEWTLSDKANLTGMFLCLKHEMKAMWEHGGAIVGFASIAAIRGYSNSADYCAHKSGVLGLVRGAAMDGAPRNIRVNAIMPGGTQTPMAESAIINIPSLANEGRLPVGRWAQPEEQAEAAIWLISPESSYVTGVALPVDGAASIG